MTIIRFDDHPDTTDHTVFVMRDGSHQSAELWIPKNEPQSDADWTTNLKMLETSLRANAAREMGDLS